MNNLRRWELTLSSPYALHLAADSRLSLTRYADDQVWEVLPGKGDNPALALHTRYGGRAGLASLIPMWTYEGRIIYQAQTYQQGAVITAFTPGYVAAEARPLPALAVHFEHFALDSQSIAGIYTLSNTGSSPLSLRFDLFGHVGAQGKEQKLAIISLAQGGHALSLGSLEHIAPVVLVENGQAGHIGSTSASPRIGRDVTVPAGEQIVIRWVHVGAADLRTSLSGAQHWLTADWQPYLESINRAALAVPTIQTGNKDWDAVLDSSYQALVLAFLRPAGIFPHETFVGARLPETGFSKSGADRSRTWEGQDVALAYLLLPVMASIYPAAAKGALKNYIAVQASNGAIDLKPGAGGQKQNLLCTPLLARIAWNIYQQTEDKAFIEDVFPALLRFFEHWLTRDLDADGVPEWSDDRQLHYVAFPNFAPGMKWSQGANIATVETPDLLAYLLSEAHHLRHMAQLTGASVDNLNTQIENLKQALSGFWDGSQYVYRDRDTHVTTSGTTILEDGAGDAVHAVNQALVVPNRLIIKVVGGVNHVPNITLTVEGLNANGNPISESAPADAFRWQNRQGIYTTQAVFSQIDRISCTGLSRAYRVHAFTLDTTGLDINHLLPLWAGIEETAPQLVDLALSKKHFLRPNGITMTSVQGEYFDPTSAEGAGGIWMYWQTLLGEALLAHGRGSDAADMVKEQLKTLVDVLQQEHRFGQFYHTDKPVPLGEKGHIGGIAPVYLLMALFGVRIISHEKVYVGGEFAWGRAVTIRQHGVYVRRTSKRIKVEFPSGYVVELEPDADWQAVIDPEPVQPPQPDMITLPDVIQAKIPTAPLEQPQRVIIEVEHED